MEAYGKIFRKYSAEEIDFNLNIYKPDEKKYHEVICEMKKRGFKQLIINSELMIEIMSQVIQNNGFILGIHFTESIDEYLTGKVKDLILKIRHKPMSFIELKELLDWTVDNNSIDISRIELLYKNSKFEIYSNGQIIGGENINVIFEEILIHVFKGYLE
ncbi:hypothetical protein [Lysinibacillus xylanilyticus]|uniref:hypothetical protein n=1 Tax=Lysinibacillus xylanilyticus TaxID=582475 RepID=UPI00083C9C11|nr:hypothetical protein [Lysinibacillus xylanilyticus]